VDSVAVVCIEISFLEEVGSPEAIAVVYVVKMKTAAAASIKAITMPNKARCSKR